MIVVGLKRFVLPALLIIIIFWFLIYWFEIKVLELNFGFNWRSLATVQDESSKPNTAISKWRPFVNLVLPCFVSLPNEMPGVNKFQFLLDARFDPLLRSIVLIWKNFEQYEDKWSFKKGFGDGIIARLHAKGTLHAEHKFFLKCADHGWKFLKIVFCPFDSQAFVNVKNATFAGGSISLEFSITERLLFELDRFSADSYWKSAPSVSSISEGIFESSSRSGVTVCINGILRNSVGLREIIQYYALSGIRHVFLGVGVADESFEIIQTRVQDFVDEGFVTVIPINGDYYGVNKSHAYREGK